MFRRYPYWGWLLLSVLLWCINGYHFHLHRQAMLPERMARAVNNDLQKREEAFETFISQQELIRRIYTDSLTEKESGRLDKLPFCVFAYERDTLKYWNTNIYIAPFNDSALDKPVVLRNEKGVFIEKCVDLSFIGGSKKLVVLFPVVITYPLENDYLHSHFVASDYIPVKTKIVAPANNADDGYPVTLIGSNPVFFLHFNPQNIQRWAPDGLLIVMLIAAMLASLSWIQLTIISLTRNRSSIAGIILTVAVILILRISLYVFGMPFNLDTLTFFSPRLYASNKYLSSFGDLFINTLCFLWLVIFITRHTPYKTYFSKFAGNKARHFISIGLMSVMIVYCFLFVHAIRSLVLDSRISFDVSHFYSINTYTILGLLIIGAIAGISCLVIYLFNIQLNVLEKNRWIKYLLVAATGTLFVFIKCYNHDLFYWGLLGWLLLFIVLLDIPDFALVSDLFEPHMLFWAVFFCAFSTGIVHYFNQLKEREDRIAYVKLELSPRRDNIAEYAFNKVDSLAQDKNVKGFFGKPSLSSRKALNHQLSTQYLSAPALNKFEQRIYIFNADGIGLFNNDSIDYFSLLDEKNESIPTNTPGLFYKESILDRHYYLSYIRVYNDTINKVIGYVIIDLDLKKQDNETVNSELVQPMFNKQHANEYAYAVYINDKLITQTNDYPFTNNLRDDTLEEQHYAFYSNKNVSELYYKIADNRTVVVVHYHSEILELITLFSYLFGIQVLLAVVILMYQLYLSYFIGATSSAKFIRLTLRKRVHFSMLGVILISFVIIGSVTILFFTIQYRSSNNNKLQGIMQVAKQSVQDYLKKNQAYNAPYIFDSISKSNNFKSYITDLANGQKTDINIYDDNGILFNTSEDDIYNKGLISNRIRPDAFYQLNNLGKSIVIQDETVAGLSYLAAYQPLRDDHGVTLGYINVPLFSSERDLNFQISNIVVTLINLYAFIFLVSSIITVAITRWITRTFDIISKQFGQLNLQRNERITWPYEDEIGDLVREYNKMVNKVEENAALLAQSERESAWREMARQVAHEIKNPLTPMKLNIQYLQQAMLNDNPNIKELTGKVSDSIIEQIDNLSYIASEFSNFATMPEARPEELELGELLNKALKLYLNDEHIKISVSEYPEKLHVYSDHSQLLRVFTNLLENAKQAIPAERTGHIDISLKAENGSAIIAIADNGQGIPEEIVKKIFQPYFTTKSSGTGLGLAMTRKIIEFWKGDIWFETKEGEGTTFYIRLPLKA